MAGNLTKFEQELYGLILYGLFIYVVWPLEAFRFAFAILLFLVYSTVMKVHTKDYGEKDAD